MRLFALLIFWLVVGLAGAGAHQPFRIVDPTGNSVEPDIPVIEEVSTFENDDCSVFAGVDGANFYAIPKQFYRVPGPTNSLLGVSLESERQDHIMVILLHSVDARRMQSCMDTFVNTTQKSAQSVHQYPAQVLDVSLISDPNDFRVLKFHFMSSAEISVGNRVEILTILQSSSRKNVRTIKKLLANEVRAIAALRIHVKRSTGTIEFRTLTVPLTLGNISLSSQGL